MDIVMLAIPAGYSKPRVLRALHDTLAASSFTVWVSAALNDLSPPPNLVAVLDGWADLAIDRAIASLQSLLPSVPTLAVVTDRRTTAAALLRAGFDDCIKWPTDLNRLEARARAQLRARSSSEPCAIVVDPMRFTIRCNQVHLVLTPGQFRVLNLLVKSPGCWLNSAQLKQASDAPRTGGTTVAAHVHAIRNKLQVEAWRLRGHRSLGYCFDASPAVPTRRVRSAREIP